MKKNLIYIVVIIINILLLSFIVNRLANDNSYSASFEELQKNNSIISMTQLEEDGKETIISSIPSGYDWNARCECTSGKMEYDYDNKRFKIKETSDSDIPLRCNVSFYKIKNLKNQILADNEEQNDASINFGQTSSASNTSGLYYTADVAARGEDGMRIHYFRGGDYCANANSTVNTSYLTKSACQGAGLTWRTLNNNVIFAGKCWQIIRTNKNGSVRVIYNGVPEGGICNATGTNSQVGTSAFNAETKTINGVAYNTWTDASSVGYMHGSPEGHTYEEYVGSNYNFGLSVAGNMYVGTSITKNTQTGTFTLNGATQVSAQKPNTTTYKYICYNGTPTACTRIFEFTAELTGESAPYTSTTAKAHTMNWSRSLEDAHSNEMDSNIKTYLESWYEENLLIKYNSYIADAGYCNDREVASGDGYGASATFKPYERLIGTTKVPTLTCTNKARDLYTVANAEGNRASKYPIGLITADETSYAGAVYGVANNTNYYIHTGNYYWIMSPSVFNFTYAHASNWNLESLGLLNYNDVIADFGVRPVVSLKSCVMVLNGTGSKDNPYVISAASCTKNATTFELGEESGVVYVGGIKRTINIIGENYGSLSIASECDEDIAICTISGSTLKIEGKGAGTTSIKIKEGKTKKTVTYNVTSKVTTLSLSETSGTVYVGGSNRTATISGTNMGSLSIKNACDTNIATCTLSGTTLTIAPGTVAGTTSITINESNGNKTVTYNVTSKVASTLVLSETSGSVYVGGSSKTISITGNYGALSVTSGCNTSIATCTISGSSLIVTGKGSGSTSITIKEATGNKTATYTVTSVGTSLAFTPTSGTVYVGGSSKTSTISGTNMGLLAITSGCNTSIATCTLSGTTLTITPKATAGSTSVIVREGNGNKTATYTVTNVATSIAASPASGTIYVGGSSKTATISGSNMGTLAITSGCNTSIATCTLSGTTLTITPKATAGSTSVIVREGNGNKTATYTVTNVATSIAASPASGIVYVGGTAITSTISGTNRGTLAVTSGCNTSIATCTLSGTTLTVTPGSTAGSTSVTIREGNGNKTVTYSVTNKATTLNASTTSVSLETDGGSTSVTFSGTNMGTLSITSACNTSYASCSLSGTTLTITPRSNAGSTSVTVREANGRKTKTIYVTVTQSEPELVMRCTLDPNGQPWIYAYDLYGTAHEILQEACCYFYKQETGGNWCWISIGGVNPGNNYYDTTCPINGTNYKLRCYVVDE